MFIRYPGVAVHGRGEGGHIRVMRMVFSARAAKGIFPEANKLSLQLLQSLLDIHSAALRMLMRLALRELTNEIDASVAAMNAILELVAIEVRRILEPPSQVASSGRLAGWQYRRIRERLSEEETVPAVQNWLDFVVSAPVICIGQFLSLTGMTVAKYVESFQIERAKGMLG